MTHRVKNNKRIQYKDPNNNGSEWRPTTDKIQIRLRVLKINEGTISLPRPNRRDSQANVIRLHTCRLHWNSIPEGVSTINSTGK